MPTTFNFGRFNVTRIEEMLTPGFDPAFLFPDYQSDILTIQPQLSGEGFWHAPSGKLMSSMHSWLIRTDQHVILIDTGCGNGKSRALPLFERFHQLNKPYLDRLAQAGVNPQDVTWDGIPSGSMGNGFPPFQMPNIFLGAVNSSTGQPRERACHACLKTKP